MKFSGNILDPKSRTIITMIKHLRSPIEIEELKLES